MTQLETRELVSFLVNCSRTSLGNFLLIKQSRASNLERDLRDLLARLVENVAFVELANILRDHGEEIVGSAQVERESDLATSPTPIPVNWWRWILRRRDLSLHEKIVALAIKGNSDRNGECRTYICTLALDCSLGKSSVKKAMKSLRDKGLLETTRTGPHALKIRAVMEPSLPERGPYYGLSGAPLRPFEGSITATVSEVLEEPARNGHRARVLGRAVTPEDPRLEPTPSRLKELQLQAEILGRTERLQKSSQLSSEQTVGAGPVLSEEGRKRLLDRIEKRKAKGASRP